MNRFFAAAFAGLALSLPLGAMAAPDEAQKQLIQRAQEAKKTFRIRVAMPKEGAVIGLDAMVIAKNAPRPDLAHKFINFMLDAQNSADLTNMLGTGNPNKAAVDFIKPEIKAMSAVFPDEETAKKLEMLRPLNPEERRLQSQIWTEIKAK